jgi:transketolase
MNYGHHLILLCRKNLNFLHNNIYDMSTHINTLGEIKKKICKKKKKFYLKKKVKKKKKTWKKIINAYKKKNNEKDIKSKNIFNSKYKKFFKNIASLFAKK